MTTPAQTVLLFIAHSPLSVAVVAVVLTVQALVLIKAAKAAAMARAVAVEVMLRQAYLETAATERQGFA